MYIGDGPWKTAKNANRNGAARNNVSYGLGNLFEMNVVIYTAEQITNFSNNKYHT